MNDLVFSTWTLSEEQEEIVTKQLDQFIHSCCLFYTYCIVYFTAFMYLWTPGNQDDASQRGLSLRFYQIKSLVLE